MSEKFEIEKKFKPYKTFQMGYSRKLGAKKRAKTRLYFILKEFEMSQIDLAELADMELCQVSLLVTGRGGDITMNTAKRVCNALQLTLNDVFGIEDTVK